MDTIKKLTILIAEDDDGHAELIRDGLCDSGICNPLIRFIDGQAVWEFLSEGAVAGDKGEVFDKNNSYLLLLDIRMPRMDGVEVLRNMKNDARFKRIPVIMLTTTDDPREINQCYDIGCNVYITKPVDFNKLTETLSRLGLFLQIVKV